MDALAGKRGAAIAIDPRTGDVIALAQHARIPIPTPLRAGLTHQAIRRAAKRHRQAADQSRAARRYPARLHGQAILRIGPR